MTHAAKEEVATTRQGICVHCRRLLHATAFRTDGAGNLTSWCDSCRDTIASKWKIDPELLEMVYALYCFEQQLQKDADVMLTLRHGDPETSQPPSPGILTHPVVTFRARIADANRLKSWRIPYRLGEFLETYRQLCLGDWGIKAFMDSVGAAA